MKKLLLGLLMILMFVGCSSIKLSVKHNAFVPKNEVCLRLAIDSELECFKVKGVMGIKNQTIIDKPNGKYILTNNSVTKTGSKIQNEEKIAYISVGDNTIALEIDNEKIVFDRESEKIIECSDKKLKPIINQMLAASKNIVSYSSGDIFNSTSRFGGLSIKLKMMTHGIIEIENIKYLFSELHSNFRMKGFNATVSGFIIIEIENTMNNTTKMLILLEKGTNQITVDALSTNVFENDM